MIGLIVGGGSFLSWWTLMTTSYRPPVQANRQAAIDRHVSTLIDKIKLGEATGLERRELLERLLVQGEWQAAQRLLEQTAAEERLPLNLTLLMADLKRRNGDLVGADQTLVQVLQLHPKQKDALRLQIAIHQQQGKEKDALNDLENRMKEAPQSQKIDLGLLLADLQHLVGDSDGAAQVYLKLASEFPQDARPLMALALLRQQEGKPNDVQILLNKARVRRAGEGQKDEVIDALAARWGLAAARIKALSSAGVRPDRSDKP